MRTNRGVPLKTRSRWPIDRLVQERNTALNSSLARSSNASYDAALRSWLNFSKLHEFDIEPNADTLSFYIAYESFYIEPRSIDTYLSGIINKLEPHFPNVRKLRSHQVVKRTLAGCMRLRSSPVIRKRPMLISELKSIITSLKSSAQIDDLLFVALVTSGFFGLHRLGELTQPDNLSIRDWRRNIRRTSLLLFEDRYEYMLPTSKADRQFHGNVVVIQKLQEDWDPHSIMRRYVRARDTLFPMNPWLWITSDGSIPSRSWVLKRLRVFLGPSISGHSIRSGGATFLALNKVPDERIQAIGRWSSDAWKIYIRKHPVLLQSLVWGRPTFSVTPANASSGIRGA